MNNKLITYEQAKQELKFLEPLQRLAKKFRDSYKYSCKAQIDFQKTVRENRDRINMLLSIIHAHKQARKYYGKLRPYLEEEKNLLNQFGE